MFVGSDTTASALKTFVLAMCTHPQQLDLAQQEVDKHCAGRSPIFEDFEDLPFVRAVSVLRPASLLNTMLIST